MKTQFKAPLLAPLSLLLAVIAAIACTSGGEYASNSDVAAAQDRASANEASISQLTARLDALEAEGGGAELPARVDELESKLATAETKLTGLAGEMATIGMKGKPSEAGATVMQAMPEPRFSRDTATARQRAKIEEAIACASDAYDHIADEGVKATLLKAAEENAWLSAAMTQHDSELDSMVHFACGPIEGEVSQGDGEGLPLPPIPGAGGLREPRFNRDSTTQEQRDLIEATLYCGREKNLPLPAGMTTDDFSDQIWQSAAMTFHDAELRMMALMTCAASS